MTWTFSSQAKVGDKGAALLRAHWPLKVLEHADPKGPDFVDQRARVIELKTDSRSLEESANFFMERWGNKEKRGAGGPWQALQKGSTCFVYLYLPSRTWFVFEDLPALVERLNALLLDLKPVRVPNRGWTTVGYKVPRSELKDLYREEQLPPDSLKEGA